MNRIFLAVITALVAAGMLISPAAAASPASVLASETCGSTYTVKNRDNLTKIASYCGTTVADLVALNPQITDPNLIYTGQVLRVSGSVTSTASYATTYTVESGDTLSGIASMFGVTIYAIQLANPALLYNATIYSGQVLYIPASTSSGNYSSSGYPTVILSTTSASVGDAVTVYVSGFPANSYIDYRVGREDESYSTVYDGVVAADGTSHQTITIPSGAEYGEYWVVLVTTTSQKNGVEVTSHTIFIDG